MDPTLVGTAGVAALLVLIFSGLHIGLALSLVGGAGMCLLMGARGGLDILGSSPFAVAASYDLSPLPLFLLMGSFALNGGIGAMVYEAMSKLLGRLHGGLAIATTFACAFFGMICGSSLATAGIFTKIALPEMLKRGMDKRLSIGTISSAGTFATLIPPSGLMIIYCILTEQSIGRMFMAGFVPGFISAFAFSALTYIRVKRKPTLAPLVKEGYKLSEKVRALISIWPIIFFAALVLGGIFAGWFTATEGAAVGAFGTLLFAVVKKGIRQTQIPSALIDCMKATGMIFLVIIGAIIFGRFLSVTQLPVNVAAFLGDAHISRTVFLASLVLLYFVLGMLLDSVAILCITIPVVFPVVMQLGFDPIWFGIFLIKMCEIGQITPPVGMNVYVAVAASEGSVSLEDAFKGIIPFLTCDLCVLFILIIFPELSLWLPNLVFGS
ncbi:MAG: TRAP transporter large permease [Syntrophorhabdaceae bacterium]|nr:TRAP transporter large permease [Syntrophorhabdaceae bacterium]MDD5243878.1 TRAP transporter large permease [Syntrophorhabdaceae bacterium]